MGRVCMKTNKDIHSSIGSESCLWVSYILSSFLKGFKERSSSACGAALEIDKEALHCG